MEAKIKFKRGDVVLFSQAGLDHLKPIEKNRHRIGLVTGFSRDGKLVKVIWQGTSYKATYSHSFIITRERKIMSKL